MSQRHGENTQENSQREDDWEESDAATEEIPNQSQQAALVQQNRAVQQRPRSGILRDEFYQLMEKRGQSAVTNTARNTADQLTGSIEETLRLRLDLNLDLEVRLRAHVHGDLTLALL